MRPHPAAEAAGAGCADVQMSSRQSVLSCRFCCGTRARHPHSLASLLQVDKRISEITEDRFHAPAPEGVIILGTAYHADCFLRPQVG